MCGGADATTEKKRAKMQAENGEVKASPTNSGGSGNNALNLPIANSKAKAAIVKVTTGHRYLDPDLNSQYQFCSCCTYR